MLRIDNSLLQEIGLGSLPDSEKNSLLKHIYDTLEMRVGMRLADQMSNEQLDEFKRYYENKDDAGAFKWLETNFPNYKDIVQEEFDKLKNEVAQSAPQILSAATQQSPAANAQPQQPPANPVNNYATPPPVNPAPMPPSSNPVPPSQPFPSDPQAPNPNFDPNNPTVNNNSFNNQPPPAGPQV